MSTQERKNIILAAMESYRMTLARDLHHYRDYGDSSAEWTRKQHDRVLSILSDLRS